jgi:hypothetical protein
VAPSSARAAQRGLQRPRGPAIRRRAERQGPRGRPGADRRTPRAPAHPFRGPGRSAGTGDRPGRVRRDPLPADRRSRKPEPQPPGLGVQPPRPGRGPPAVRPRAWPRIPFRAPPAFLPGARPALHPAPHRERRLVHRDLRPGAGHLLHGSPRRPAAGPAGAPDPVRGLRDLAAPDPDRPGPGAAPRLLARPARRPRAGPRAPGRPPPAGPPDSTRPSPPPGPVRASHPGAPGVEPPAGDDPLRHPARGLLRPPLPADLPAGPLRRHPGRRTPAGRDRRPDRLLCEHAGGPRRPLGRPHLPRASEARARSRARRPGSPGRSVRAAGLRARAGAEPDLHPGVPGPLRPPERPGRVVGPARPGGPPDRNGPGDDEVRLDAGPRRERRSPGRRHGVQPGPVRRAHDRPRARPARGHPGGGGGRARGAAVRRPPARPVRAAPAPCWRTSSTPPAPPAVPRER